MAPARSACTPTWQQSSRCAAWWARAAAQARTAAPPQPSRASPWQAATWMLQAARWCAVWRALSSRARSRQQPAVRRALRICLCQLLWARAAPTAAAWRGWRCSAGRGSARRAQCCWSMTPPSQQRCRSCASLAAGRCSALRRWSAWCVTWVRCSRTRPPPPTSTRSTAPAATRTTSRCSRAACRTRWLRTRRASCWCLRATWAGQRWPPVCCRWRLRSARARPRWWRPSTRHRPSPSAQAARASRACRCCTAWCAAATWRCCRACCTGARSRATSGARTALAPAASRRCTWPPCRTTPTSFLPCWTTRLRARSPAWRPMTASPPSSWRSRWGTTQRIPWWLCWLTRRCCPS
mmetsp:Transcript_32878/g.83430  ORF Transcript_32878/g.83430 Transcript_32878/m.83430 type:complete len:352 (-) Transcript_32878:2117-3172(-)